MSVDGKCCVICEVLCKLKAPNTSRQPLLHVIGGEGALEVSGSVPAMSVQLHDIRQVF